MASAPPRPDVPRLTELPLVIDTPRLRLRPLLESDVDDLWPHVSDDRLTPYMSWSAHRDREETAGFLRGAIALREQGTDMIWAIEHEGRASGCVGLHAIRFAFRAWRVDRAELGYWIAMPLWGQGLMTEAATAATRWGFETLGLHKVTVGCIEDNVASRRVIEKIGFRYLGKQEDDVWRAGRWWPHLRFELLASEWADSARTLRFARPPLP
jgi:ribosomal-protein-alanine N-acetyltransferase